MQLRQQFSTFQAAKVLVVVVLFTVGVRLVVILEVDYTALQQRCNIKISFSIQTQHVLI